MVCFKILVIPTSIRRSAFDGRVDRGQIKVFGIPFHMFEAAWFGIWNEKAESMEWRKLMVSNADQRNSSMITTGIMEERSRVFESRDGEHWRTEHVRLGSSRTTTWASGEWNG